MADSVSGSRIILQPFARQVHCLCFPFQLSISTSLSLGLNQLGLVSQAVYDRGWNKRALTMQGKNKMCAMIKVKMVKTKRQAMTFLTGDHTLGFTEQSYSDPSREQMNSTHLSDGAAPPGWLPWSLPLIFVLSPHTGLPMWLQIHGSLWTLRWVHKRHQGVSLVLRSLALGETSHCVVRTPKHLCGWFTHWGRTKASHQQPAPTWQPRECSI